MKLTIAVAAAIMASTQLIQAVPVPTGNQNASLCEAHDLSRLKHATIANVSGQKEYEEYVKRLCSSKSESPEAKNADRGEEDDRDTRKSQADHTTYYYLETLKPDGKSNVAWKRVTDKPGGRSSSYEFWKKWADKANFKAYGRNPGAVMTRRREEGDATAAAS